MPRPSNDIGMPVRVGGLRLDMVLSSGSADKTCLTSPSEEGNTKTCLDYLSSCFNSCAGKLFLLDEESQIGSSGWARLASPG